MSIDEALHLFMTQLEADGRSAHTIAQYRRHVRLLAEWLAAQRGVAAVDVTSIGPHEVATFLASPRARCRTSDPATAKRATTVNALRSSIRNFGAFLERADLVAKSPARLVRRAMCAVAPPPTLEVEEQRRLLDCLDGATDALGRRDRAIIRLMLSVGLRATTVLSLDVDDLPRSTEEVELRTMKGGRADRIPVPAEVLESLREVAKKRGSGPLFASCAGHRLGRRQLDRRLKLWGRRAGLQRSLHAHRLRHTVGQRVFDTSGCILTVASVLRHASVSSSARYARVGPERLRHVIGDTWNGTLREMACRR